MESHLICEPHDNQHVVRVLHAVLNSQNEDEPFIPSEFFNEMKLSTEDRLESLCRNRKNRVLPEPTPFLATPDMIIFQNFQLGRWYSATLTLQNKEQSSRCVKTIFEPTVHFRLLHPGKVVWTKLAPGMTYQVVISFSGDENRDYVHEVTFVTEEEKFTIPIYAFKSRPLVDFPDFLRLPDVPINMSSEKNIIICNYSAAIGSFSIIATDPHCSVCPTKAVLGLNEKIFLKIKIKTTSEGPARGAFIVKFDDDVTLKMLVECNAVSSTIHLEDKSISFADTFMGLQRQVPLTIEYRGIGHGYFKWKLYQDRHFEHMRKLQFKEMFEEVRDVETFKAKPLKRMGIINQEGHAAVYQRIFSDEVEEIEANEEFPFRSPVFSILPLSGEMGRNGFLEFTVIFSPQTKEQYETVAYLEVAGCEQRIPLKLQGTGLGPEFKLNIAYLDANNIFLRSIHEYEIIVANTGHIPGSLTFIEKQLEFGGRISCDPDTLYISADHYAAFVMSFTPGEEGKFIEKVEFVVNESKETVHFIMTGNVIAPLLNLEIQEIDFGIVALGYRQHKRIALCNNSPVPIQYHIEISGDGYQTPIDCEAYLQDATLPQYPQEFVFDPVEGIVDENSKTIGLLRLLPNINRKLVTEFVVHMWGSKNYCISVPLKYDCRVADVVCIPPKIDIKFCFISYVYDRKIVLKNQSELPCYFRFMPLQGEGVSVVWSKGRTVCIEQMDGLRVEVTVVKNDMQPLEEVTLPLKIRTPLVGIQEIPLFFSIFGKSPEMLCQVICNGQGPAVCFSPPTVNFGQVTLLDTVTKEVEILNDTPIPATINFAFKGSSNFSMKELEKVMPPSSKLTIEVSVYLTDPGRTTQVLWANVENGQEVAVPLTAWGEGTSISCHPKLEPKLDVGTLLTYKKFSFPIHIKNEGSRWHKLWFSRSDDYKTAKKAGNSSAGFLSIFKVTPNYFHLMSKESEEIKIFGSRKEQGLVSEHFYCHAVIERSHKRHVIISFEAVAKFVDPHVHLNKSELNFHLDVSSEGVFASLRDKIKIKNESGLALEIDLVVQPPFYIIVDGKAVGALYLKLNNLSNRTVIVEFHPPPHPKRCVAYNQTFYVNYKDHPKVEGIPVHGVINYPTLSIAPSTIDFGCVPLGSSSYRTVVLNNVSSLPVIYKWVWVDDIEERSFETSVIPSSPDASIQMFLKDGENSEEESLEHSLNDETSQSEDKCHIEEKIRSMLNSLLEKIEENEDEQSFLRFLPTTTSKTKFSEIFNVVPHEGCLEPEESITATFRFTPRPNTEVSGTIYCHVVGGANEPVTLTGKCRPITYYIKDYSINFGRIYFYEASEAELPLTNNGEGLFNFAVSDATLPNGWLTVEPSSGIVPPGETFPLTIRVFPGTIGRFSTSFSLEVDYLDPVTITVYGFGVYPQIYFGLPRPDLENRAGSFIAYSAIAEVDDVASCACAKDYFPDTDRRILEDDDWGVIALSDTYPCMMEIELSIERIIGKYQLDKDTNLLNKLERGEKFWPIPNFVVAAYVFDLGCIQINTKTLYKLSYLNYGPGRTVVRTHTSPTFSQHGFDAPSVRQMMDLRQVSDLHLSFYPTTEKFPDLNTKFTEFIYMDIRNGAKIPIQLEVLVATPTVVVSDEEVDFGAIRCGDCLRKSINIINNGYLRSTWRASIDESLKAKSKLKPSFFLLNREGSLDPGEKFYLRIYFEPHYDDFLNAELTITVDGNDRQTVVQLKGFGMEPFLEITEERITFEPNIPYSCDNDKYVTIRNASKFPVEFFFPDFDSKIIQEENLVRTYVTGHMFSRVYFPYRAPGEDLPPMFQSYYDALIREIEEKNITRRRSSSLIKKSKVVASPGSNRSREMSLMSWSPRSHTNLEQKSNQAKDNIVNNYVMKKFKKMLRESIGSPIPPPKVSPDSEIIFEDPPAKGMLIVFHGAPLSGYIKAAHETGKALNLPVYSIDCFILECLVRNTSPTTQEVNNIINQAFDEVAEDSEYESSISEDSYDVLAKKVLVLLEGKEKKKKPKAQKKKGDSAKSSKSSKKSSKDSKKSKKSAKSSKKSGKKASESSDKSKKSKKDKDSKGSKSKKKKVPITDTLINIPQQLLCNLLEENLQNFKQGLIIESLTSNFLRKTMVAVNCLLQLANKVQEVHFVILWSTFEKYLESEVGKEQEHMQQEVKNLEEFEASIDDMDAIEFVNLENEHPDLYHKYLKKRKDDLVRRHELVKQKILERRQAMLRAQRKEKEEVKRTKKADQDSSKVSIKQSESDKVKKSGKKKDADKDSKKSKKSKKWEKSSTDNEDIKETSEKSSKKSKASKKSETSEKSKKSKSSKKSKKSKSSGKSKKSSKSSKKSTKDKKKKKLTKEQAEMKQTLDSFEDTLQEILHTLEFWDKTTGFVSQSVTTIEQKSDKKKNKSKNGKSRKTPATTPKTPKSAKTATSEVTVETTATEAADPSDIGIPCWIISDNNFESIIENFVPNLMKRTVDSEISHEQQVTSDYIEPPLLQSVLPKSKPRTFKRTEVFMITDSVEEKEDTSKLKLNTTDVNNHVVSKVSLPKRKRSKNRNSSHIIEKPQDLPQETFTFRGLLQPGETIKYKISFLPKVIGNYKHQFDIGVIGSPLKFTITCIACCDVPRIDMDPYSLFERVLEDRTERTKYSRGVFINHTNRFEFGGILLPSTITNSTFESRYCVYLNNISRITCDVAFSIQRDCQAFQFQPESHIIEPKARQEMTVVASPFEEQLYDDKLILSIKNNPKIERIVLSCYGCEIGVDVNPKHVIFERVTLEISLTKNIVITNNTPVEVVWNFVNCEEVLENFSINSFWGRIAPFSFQTSTIEFTAKEMEVHSCSFTVNIHDTYSRLVYTTNIMVSAETTALEFFYQNELDYGDIKGCKSYSIPFHMTSKGRYEILCRFTEITEEGLETDSLKSYFKIDPIEGKILPNIRYEAVITFAPDKAMSLEKLPVFRCCLIDSFHAVVIKSFDILISAKVFLSKFEICPYPEICFGYQAVGQEKLYTFQISNKGKFEFTYAINEYVKEEEGKKDTKKKGKKGSKDKSKSKSKSSKGSKKSTKSKKSKSSKKTKKSKQSKKSKGSKKSKSSKRSETKKKPKPTTLKFGIFSLTSSSGIVDPNEEATVEVSSRPVESGNFLKTIIINVTEPSWGDRNGKLMKVQVTACEPKVNFEEISNIFKEQYVVERMDDIVDSNINMKVIFARSEMKLKFCKVCVNTTTTTRIRIQNIGHVTAKVIARFSKSNHIFTVSPDAFSIDPYQTESVMIIYTPDSLDEHISLLTFECRGFKTVDTLVVEVIGEACVPEILLLEPEQEGTTFLNLDFYPTLLGNSSDKRIAFKNVGLIPCKVIVEVCFDDHDQLSLIPKEEVISSLNLWDPNAPMHHTTMVNLNCGAVATFTLQFRPQKIGTWKPEVKIHTVNNPFETKTIHIFCEGYYMDVIFEGLPTYSKGASIQSIDSVPVLAYLLNYGHLSLNTLEKKCFLIKNNSDDHTYKFEFPSYHEVIFSPAVGHIRPKTSKQVLAVFLSREPVDLDEIRIECKLHKIEYAEPQPDLTSWDDRQHFVVWCHDEESTESGIEIKSDTGSKTSSKVGSMASASTVEDSGLSMKKIEENPEPTVTVIPDSSQNIVIFVSVVAGYATFFSDTRELQISDTFVMNKSSATFDVENTGKVVLKISWTITMDELPRRINSCKSVGTSEEKCQEVANSKHGPVPLCAERFSCGEPLPRSTSASTLFSSDTLETNRSADSWSDAHSLPFVVTPNKASIEPSSKGTFTVTFGPVDVFDYIIQLKSSIENRDPTLKEMEINVKARSILPVYCFELEPSDYVETRRKGRKMCNELLDENTKVVEFESVGLGVICTRKFYLKNPTKEEFIYTWQPALQFNPKLTCFHCHTPTGKVTKGKTVEMVFSFIPQDCGVFEEFYFFNIPLRDIRVIFLLVGTAREPKIHFDQSHVNLPPTVVGIDVNANVMLKNEEPVKYRFKFGKLPMMSDGLSIKPSQGFLDANEVLPMRILYSPKKKCSVTFDLKCSVEKIKAPLELSVSCSCFEVEASASYIDYNGKEIHLQANRLNSVNMGVMVPHQKYEIPITITNIGKTGFQWYWDMRIAKIAGLFDVSFDSNEVILHPNETTNTKLALTPLIRCRMQPHKIYLKIPYGPTYALQISGHAGRPPYKLSFSEYDFGPCLVQTAETKYYKTMLKFSNYNIFPMTLEKGKHEVHISTDFQCGEVPAQEQKNISIYFHPLILGEHRLELPLYIDSKRTHVTILGKAVPLKLTLVDQVDKFIELGSVLVGKTCTRTVRVLNGSECPISVFFNFWNRLPKRPTKETPDDSIEIPEETPPTPKEKKKTEGKGSKGSKKKKEKKSDKRSKSSKKSSKKHDKKSKTSTKSKSKKGPKGSKKSKESKKSKKSKQSKKSEEKITPTIEMPDVPVPKQGIDFMTITPDKAMKVPPRKTTEFKITFSPKEKVEPFIEKIYYQIENYVDCICMVKGNSIAPSIYLDRNHLTFGNVVVNFECMMNAILRNTGDISLKFNWLLDKKEENFFISPNKGYILPGTDLIFNVYFRPKTVKCWIKSKLICHIANMNKQLQLSVSGSCINPPPPKGTISFACPVRETDTKTITISNPSNQMWELAPHISGDSSFKTTEITRIPPHSEDGIKIVFAPMTLNEKDATFCVPTPNGQIVSYTLKGIVNAPTPVKINREVFCKVQHVEGLTVKNWLLKKQQFHVTTTINGPINARNLFSVGGNTLIEVPPNGTRVYDWSITPINEGPLELKVLFTNKVTKEYQWYEISLKVVPNYELDVIELSTCARNPITKLIKLENPLPIPVLYEMTCPQNNLQFEKSVTLDPHSLYYLEVTYKPLFEEHETKTFNAFCKEMGTFSYSLVLTAHPPIPEPAVTFKTYLGHSLTQNIVVVDTKTSQYKFDSSIFYLNSIVNDHTLSVTFEPEQIGRFQNRLVLKSATLGDFIYPLIGDSCPPKPQGPFLLTHSAPATITFKNPFNEEKKFYFRTESGAFTLKQTSEDIGSKKVFKVVVSLLKQTTKDGPKFPEMGKLTISCQSPDICWVYYLLENIE